MQEFELVSCADHNKSGISEENSSNSLDMNLTSKRKTRAPVSGSCYGRNRARGTGVNHTSSAWLLIPTSCSALIVCD